MKKNKISKILSMLLVCVVTLGTTACEKKSDASSQSKTYKKEISKIVVATGDSSVPSSYVENGKHKGFEVDFWNAISEKTGIEVEFIIGEFSSLFGYLDSGKANTVANLITVTEERKEKYDFSEPYAYIPQKMIVNENLKDVNKIDDLEGLKCAYVAGSNSGDLFKQLAKERNLNIDLQVFESGALMLEAFNQGKVNVFIAAENEGLARIKSGTIKARIADETINYVAEAYPFIKGDKNAQEINKIASDCIKEFRKDGTLSELETKWYTNDYSKEQVTE